MNVKKAVVFASFLLAVAFLVSVPFVATAEESLQPGVYTIRGGQLLQIKDGQVAEMGPSAKVTVEGSVKIRRFTPRPQASGVSRKDLDDGFTKLGQQLTQPIKDAAAGLGNATKGITGTIGGIDEKVISVQAGIDKILGSIFDLAVVAVLLTIGLGVLGFCGVRWLAKKVATVDREKTNRFIGAVNDLGGIVSGLRDEMVTKLAVLRRQGELSQPTAEEVARQKQRDALIERRDVIIKKLKTLEAANDELEDEFERMSRPRNPVRMREIAGLLEEGRASYAKFEAELADIKRQLGEGAGMGEAMPMSHATAKDVPVIPPFHSLEPNSTRN